MNCKYFIYSIVFSVLVGCVDRTDILTINLDKIRDTNFKKSYRINDIAQRVHYLSLEENSGSLLTGVEKMEASSDYLFVLDRECLFQFDMRGKFIRQIGGFGKGPNEFSCYDFDIDLITETIYILDYFQGKIVKYTFNGVFVESYKNPVSINSKKPTYGISYIKCLGHGKILLTANSNTHTPEFHMYDETKKVIYYTQNNNSLSKSGSIILPENNIFYNIGGQMYGKHMFSDTVYCYSSEGKKNAKYLIKTGKLSIKVDDLNSIETLPPKHSVLITNILENSYFIMIFYKYFINKKDYKQYLAYYDKENPFSYDSFTPILYFEEEDGELFNKDNFDNHGTFKIKDSRIDGSSKMFLAKDGNLYQVRLPMDFTEKRKEEFQIGPNNPCIIKYVLNDHFMGHLGSH